MFVGRDGDVKTWVGVLGVAHPLDACAEGGAGRHRLLRHRRTINHRESLTRMTSAECVTSTRDRPSCRQWGAGRSPGRLWTGDGRGHTCRILRWRGQGSMCDKGTEFTATQDSLAAAVVTQKSRWRSGGVVATTSRRCWR
jgi:hypothetical protein